MVKKENQKKNVTIQCSEVKRVEAGQSAFVLPHVNMFLNADSANAKQTAFIHHGGTSGDSLRYAHMMKPVKKLYLNCF